MVDANGQPLTRTVTSTVGQFTLVVAPTARMIQVRRIGFLPQDLPLPDSARAGSASVDVTLQHIPTQLEPMKVADNSTCPRAASAPAALALWEQARDGLLAAVVARAARGLTVRLLRYDRIGSARSGILTSLAVFEQDSMRLFASPRSADALATDGYQSTNASGITFFMGPDADVLMASSFLATHCFSLARADAAHPGQVGIAFAPVPENANIGIAGVLWTCNNLPLALDALDFAYVNSGPNGAPTGNSGSIRFVTASNGVIAIDEWQLRLVEMTGPVTSEIREVGGILVFASWADSARLRHPLGTITGVVTDASTHQPVPQALVSIDRSTYRAVTGAAGAFQLSDVMPWSYDLLATDSTLGAFSIVRTGSTRVSVTGSNAVSTSIQINSRLDAAPRGVRINVARRRDQRAGDSLRGFDGLGRSRSHRYSRGRVGGCGRTTG